MAATFTPNDAFDYVKVFMKNMPLDNPRVKVRVMDSVAKIMWMAAPWRWTIGSLPLVTLASNTQDYSVALPSDYLYTLAAYTTDTADRIPKHLKIIPAIAPGGVVGNTPSMIAVTGAAGGAGQMRVSPKPGTLPASPSLQVPALYKKVHPTVTQQNMDTSGVLVFDDEWFWVYESGVLWQAYLYGDDQRAGSVTWSSDGKAQFTGQRGVFEANLQFMREREKLLLIDDDRMVPEQKRGA